MGGEVQGRGELRDSCNSIINKIYFLNVFFYLTNPLEDAREPTLFRRLEDRRKESGIYIPDKEYFRVTGYLMRRRFLV